MLLRWKTSNLIFDSIPAKLFDQFFHSFEVLTKNYGGSVPRGNTSSSCSILCPIYLNCRISANICFQICLS